MIKTQRNYLPYITNYLLLPPVGLVILLWVWLVWFSPIDKIYVNKNLNVIGKVEIDNILTSAFNRKQLEFMLDSHPYIESYRIEQIGLHEIKLTIKELSIIAKWGKDQHLLINGTLRPIVSGGNNSFIPMVIADELDAKRIADQIDFANISMKSMGLALQKYETIAPQIRKMTFSKNMIVMLNDNDYKKRITRFFQVINEYSQMINKNKFNYFDLRYDYGIAVSHRGIKNG